MIKTVIFDIGCVLLGFDWDRYVHKLFDDDETCRIVTECAFRCPYWKELDRGLMEESDILAHMISQRPDYEAQITESVEMVAECVERLDYAIPWIDSLRERGYQVLYLSNYSEYVLERSTHAMDFIEHMDGGIFSWKVKTIKPENRIYELLIERYGLKPEECAFIDDTLANVETARSLGMKGIIFSDYEQASKELEKILA